MPLIENTTTALLLWAAIGYLLGSIPFGLILSRAMNLGNLRDIGSGSIGATNVLRTGSKSAASRISVRAAADLEPVPNTLVAPMEPEPKSRRLPRFMARDRIRPKGIDPRR